MFGLNSGDHNASDGPVGTRLVKSALDTTGAGGEGKCEWASKLIKDVDPVSALKAHSAHSHQWIINLGSIRDTHIP